MWLTGSYQVADDQFQKQANELLSNEETYQRVFKTFLEYVNYLTNAIPVWRKIAALQPGSNQTESRSGATAQATSA